MVEKEKSEEQKAALRKQYDQFGTPMPVKTPVDFKKRLAAQAEE